jgi:hypothetical protein
VCLNHALRVTYGPRRARPLRWINVTRDLSPSFHRSICRVAGGAVPVFARGPDTLIRASHFMPSPPHLAGQGDIGIGQVRPQRRPGGRFVPEAVYLLPTEVRRQSDLARVWPTILPRRAFDLQCGRLAGMSLTGCDRRNMALLLHWLQPREQSCLDQWRRLGARPNAEASAELLNVSRLFVKG